MFAFVYNFGALVMVRNEKKNISRLFLPLNSVYVSILKETFSFFASSSRSTSHCEVCQDVVS